MPGRNRPGGLPSKTEVLKVPENKYFYFFSPPVKTGCKICCQSAYKTLPGLLDQQVAYIDSGLMVLLQKE